MDKYESNCCFHPVLLPLISVVTLSLSSHLAHQETAKWNCGQSNFTNVELILELGVHAILYIYKYVSQSALKTPIM